MKASKFKEFLYPTKIKLAGFFAVIVLALITHVVYLRSVSVGIGCVGFCPVAKSIYTIVSPGISALGQGNAFFVNYPTRTFVPSILSAIFHFGLDFVWWYVISCLAAKAIEKRNRTN
ncbi:hypothetical protein J4219_04795 [Candidatus Woesearchaeota archaeon]|nr:hypothetical protein [Candidatus Woesearchaeota archaeon]